MSSVGYIRVSTVDQNSERQLANIKLDKIFEDTCSGKDTKRPALGQMIEYVRDGDTVQVHDISRMARNVSDLLRLIETFNRKGVTVQFMKEGLTFSSEKSNPMNELMLTVLGAIYQFERSMLLERQREGIAIAKAAGKYKGRGIAKPLAKIKEAIQAGASCKEVMANYQISKAYFYKIQNQQISGKTLVSQTASGTSE